MKNKSAVFSLLFIFLITILSACSEPGENRTKKAEKKRGDIVIGSVLPGNHGSHEEEGLKLAIEEINNSGGIMGRKIKVIYRDDESSSVKGKKIACEFAGNNDVVAVIGHIDSNSAISASIVYEQNKMVFITPGATSDILTQHGFRFLFRNTVTNRDFTKRLVEFAKHMKLKKVLILFVNDVYGKGLSNDFQIFANDMGIEIVGQISFNPWETDLRSEFILNANLIEEGRFDQAFDSVFIAASNPIGAELIKIAREIGVTGTFFGADGLDSRDLWKIAGKHSEGTVVCSLFHPQGEKMDQFVHNFRTKFGHHPDDWAANTYDSVKVLAFAMEKFKTIVPAKVAEALHFIEEWNGVAGPITFNSKGDLLYKKPVSLKVVRNHKFEYVEDWE